MANKSAVALFAASAEPSAPASSGSTVRLWDSLPELAAPRDRSVVAREQVEEREAAGVLDQALRDTETIRSRARAEADTLLNQARDEAALIRHEAQLEGYSSGLATARSEVEAELTEQFNARCAALEQGVASIVNVILDHRGAMWQAMEGEIAGLALEIARKIVKTEVAQNTDVVKSVIQDALRRVSDRNGVRILVNPDDLQYVRDNREDILLAIDGVQNLSIDGDRRVGRGGCIIETNAGSIDAKIETQFEQVEQAFK